MATLIVDLRVFLPNSETTKLHLLHVPHSPLFVALNCWRWSSVILVSFTTAICIPGKAFPTLMSSQQQTLFCHDNRPDPKTQKHWNLILCNPRIVHKGLPNGILNAVLSNPTTAHKGIHNLMRVAHRASDLNFILDSSDELPSLTSSAPNCGGTYVYNKNLGKSLYKICVLSFCSISGSNRKTHSAWDSSTRHGKSRKFIVPCSCNELVFTGNSSTPSWNASSN
jgi:hypothetical protein